MNEIPAGCFLLQYYRFFLFFFTFIEKNQEKTSAPHLNKLLVTYFLTVKAYRKCRNKLNESELGQYIYKTFHKKRKKIAIQTKSYSVFKITSKNRNK